MDYFPTFELVCSYAFPQHLLVAFQISDFGSAKADFGTDLAISTRSELDPGHTIKILELNYSCNL